LNNKLDTQREALLTELSSHNSTIGALLASLGSDIQVKFQSTSDSFAANALDIDNKHQDLVNIINSLKDTLGLHNSTIGALLAAVSSDIGAVK
jgi:hypothetical protein